MHKGRCPMIPAWARPERLPDMVWITANLRLFWPAAQQQHQALGRGAIVVDTTFRPTGAGHPFRYYTQAHIDETHDQDAQRMVREYDPAAEMVVVLLKPQDRVSVYRMRVIQVDGS